MEQKAKRKHPNFFDILLIVLILAVAVAAYVLSHDSGGQTAVVRTYQVELTNLREDMADCVSVGDRVTDTVKNYDMGVVTAVEVQPSISSVTDESSGIVRQVAVDGYITLLLTIESETTETEKEITTAGGYAIRTGTSVSCSAGTLVGSGYILAVER